MIALIIVGTAAAAVKPVSLAVPEPTPSPTPKPTPTPEPEVVSPTVSAAGDVSLGILQIHDYAGTFREMYDLQGSDRVNRSGGKGI